MSPPTARAAPTRSGGRGVWTLVLAPSSAEFWVGYKSLFKTELLPLETDKKEKEIY